MMMFWILETQTTNKQVSLLFLFGQVSTHTTSVTRVSQYIWTFPSPPMSLEKEQTMNNNSKKGYTKKKRFQEKDDDVNVE